MNNTKYICTAGAAFYTAGAAMSIYRNDLFHMQEDVLFHIAEFWDWQQLLALARVCNKSNQLVSTRSECWHSSYLSYTELERCFLVPNNRVCVRKALEKCPLLANITRLEWIFKDLARYSREQLRNDVRDQLQFFKHLKIIDWVNPESEITDSSWVNQTVEEPILADLVSPWVNESSKTLTTLRLLCNIASSNWIHSLNSLSFPSLHTLNVSLKRQHMVDAAHNISTLSHLRTLRLFTSEAEKEPANVLADVIRPIVKHLQNSLIEFETNVDGWTRDLVHQFSQFRAFTLCISFWTVQQNKYDGTRQVEEEVEEEPDSFTRQEIELLQACKEFHQLSNHRVNVAVIVPHFNETQFYQFLQYTSEFRQSIHLQDKQFYVNPSLQPWLAMSRCIALREIEIRFPCQAGEQYQLSLNQIQCLRPIYRQLYTFRLYDLKLAFTRMNELMHEVQQMKNLTHLDVFIHCTILLR